MTGTDERRVFVIAHTGRQDARDVAGRFCRALAQHGLPVRLLEDEAVDLDLDLPGLETVKPHAGGVRGV